MIRAVLSIALIIFLPSCRSLTGPDPAARPTPESVVRPLRDAAARDGSREVRVEYMEQVPQVTRADVTADDQDVVFRFHLQPETPGAQLEYDPHTPGGWQFQLFLDTDRDPYTGYAGYELLTRDSEASLPTGMIVLRRTEGGGGPGGWGEAIAEIPVRVSPRLIMFRIPLALLGTDGDLRYDLDLYATVAGGVNGNVPVAAFGRSYEGSSEWRHRTAPLIAGTESERYGNDTIR